MDVAPVTLSLISVVGTLAGVAMGAWFSGRSERWRLVQSYKREDRQARVKACIEYLTVFRQARTYALTNEVEVLLQPTALPGEDSAFVVGAPELTDAVQRVTGQLRLLEGGLTPIVVAAAVVQETSGRLLRRRAQQPSGPLPADLVAAAREAEQAFIGTVHRELGMEGGPRSIHPSTNRKTPS